MTWWQLRGMTQDPCKVLGVEVPPRDVDQEASEQLQAWKDGPLREAWKNGARRLHPDRGGDPEAFKALAAAYEVLRSVRHLEVWPPQRRNRRSIPRAHPGVWTHEDAAEALGAFSDLIRMQQQREQRRERKRRQQAWKQRLNRERAQARAGSREEPDNLYDGPDHSYQPPPPSGTAPTVVMFELRGGPFVNPFELGGDPAKLAEEVAGSVFSSLFGPGAPFGPEPVSPEAKRALREQRRLFRKVAKLVR